MLKQKLLHPEILEALGAAGHGSKVLLSDSNYAHRTLLGPNATIVYANFAPQLLSATPLLELIAAAIPIESVSVMTPAREGPYAVQGDPPIWNEYRRALKRHANFDDDFDQLDRFGFYDAASDDQVCLTIATGETALYACLLLTIGAIVPEV